MYRSNGLPRSVVYIRYNMTNNMDVIFTPTLGGPSEKLVRARVVYAHDDLLPYRPVVLHFGVFPFVTDAVRVRVVLDHGGDRGVPGVPG